MHVCALMGLYVITRVNRICYIVACLGRNLLASSSVEDSDELVDINDESINQYLNHRS